MASWMIHLRIADRLMDRIPDLDKTAFVMGNIAPDSGVPNADWSAYHPPKAVSHYKTKQDDETFFDIDRFLGEYFSPELIRSYSLRRFSFFLGYYVHLLTDIDWTLQIYRPVIALHAEHGPEGKNACIRKMKQDWYDLDFRFLEENPDFRAFRIYEQASCFTNDFMDIFSEDAFENRRKYICGFYHGQHGELYREYPYLSPDQADSFVGQTAGHILNQLSEPMKTWNEEAAFPLSQLQPSQFCVSEKKLREVQSWFNPSDLSGFEAIPVKMLDGTPVMTDGHTRAAAAVLAGLETVPLAWDRDELSWDMYRKCVDECRRRQVYSPEDLIRYIVPEDEYHQRWDLWCDRMQAEKTGGAKRGINDPAAVRNQYSTADKLNTRISIHSKYSTNKQGFGNWIVSHYQVREGMSVLELGCGTGGMWAGQQDIISRCAEFILSDFSEGMLGKARETLRGYSGIKYKTIDIQDIPFDKETFDVVIANMMLYHVPDLSRGLREVRRVLKKNGTFYCATYGENGIMEYIRRLFEAYPVQNHTSKSFTLQNGEKKLSPFFPDIKKVLYEDALEVTDAEDMADYIYSLAGMSDLQKIPRDEVRRVLEKNMRDGILHVPKEYGMFIAKKETAD